MSEELKPYPFCKADLVPWGVNHRHPTNDCILFNTYVYVSEIAAWNRRAQPERKQPVSDLAAFQYWAAQQDVPINPIDAWQAAIDQSRDYERGFSAACKLHADIAQPERKLTDAQPAPTRLDVMSLIHSQMHRVYASAIDREEVDTQYMHEIEDAIRALAAQPAAATVPDEREAFEKFANSLELDIARFVAGDCEVYSDCNTDYAWIAWQKRAGRNQVAHPILQGLYEHSRKPISNEPCPNCKGDIPPPGPLMPICALCNNTGLMTQFGRSHVEAMKKAQDDGEKQ